MLKRILPCAVCACVMLGLAGVTGAELDAVRALDGVRFTGCFNAVEKK